jgi:LacI family transcriptional regulator
MKRTTIKDIAIAVGVNPSTISRALNDHPDVSPEMKEKVKQVAEILHYVPNLTAVNLKSKKTKTIGLILPVISKFFIPNIINGITSVVNKRGYRLVILTSDDHLEKEMEHIKMCCHTQMDGIIISLTNQTKNLDHLKLATDFDIPIVVFDKTIPQRKFSTITIDDAKAAGQCVQYLIDKNCKHIVGVFGNKNLAISENRAEGMLDALLQNKNILHHLVYANNMLDAKIQIDELLKTQATIDGIFCMSDEVLTGASAALYAQEKLFSIITTSISDGELIGFRIPEIAYIKHDGEKMGVVAANQLFTEIENEGKSDPVFLQLETEFID